MKPLHALGEAVLGSAAILTMSSYLLDVFPAPYNSVVFGGGAGVLTATALVTRRRHKKAAPIGAADALPGMPAEPYVKPTQANGKDLEKAKLLRRYDRAFAELMSRHGAASKSVGLERLKPLLYELSPELKAWTGDARLRVYLLMQEILRDLDEPAHAKAGLELLVLILSKGGSSALEMARPMFREKVLEMYGKPTYKEERFLPRLLLLLDDYDPQRLEKLTIDAIHVWGDEQFAAAGEYLGFEELKERGLRCKLKAFLGSEIARAGNERDRTALDRAVELYHEVR